MLSRGKMLVLRSEANKFLIPEKRFKKWWYLLGVGVIDVPEKENDIIIKYFQE